MARRRTFYTGKHVLITGGSTGIGLALAKAFLAKGACITLVARTVSKLEAAVEELRALAPTIGGADSSSEQPAARVSYQAADTTVPEQIAKAVLAAEEAHGPVDVLVCNAGVACPGYFHDQPLDVFESTMQLNYLGTVATIKALYTRMVDRNAGHICIVSSAMGQMGFVGYSSYAPTKYALKGLADCLRNELLGSKVTVSIAYPPDTATPGFEHENLTKPAETKEIGTFSSVFPADQVASSIVKGIAKGRFTLFGPDLGLNFHVLMMQGLSGSWTILSLLLAMLIGGLGPLIQAVHGWLFDRIARKAGGRRFAPLQSAQTQSSENRTS